MCLQERSGYSNKVGISMFHCYSHFADRVTCREQAGVTIDLGHDPTLVRLSLLLPVLTPADLHYKPHSNMACPSCDHHECARFSPCFAAQV